MKNKRKLVKIGKASLFMVDPLPRRKQNMQIVFSGDLAIDNFFSSSKPISSALHTVKLLSENTNRVHLTTET